MHTDVCQIIRYTLAHSFDPTPGQAGQVSIKTGQKVKLVMETDSGWWAVQVGKQQGWVPSVYLVRVRAGLLWVRCVGGCVCAPLP